MQFNITARDIKKIPFEIVRELYNDAEASVYAGQQAILDAKREQDILRYSRDLSLGEGGSSEINFSDAIPIIKARPSAASIDKAATDRINEEFIKPFGIPNHIDWIMAQVISMIGKMPFTASGKDFRNENFTTDWLKGVFRFININTKSVYLKLQYKAPHKSFGALVPIVMYSHKLVAQTPYSAWKDVEYIVHSDLADAMLYDGEVPSNELLLEYREQGLEIKTGAKSGSKRSPVSTHKLYGVSDTLWNSIPPLAQVMYAQIWMAHPVNRTKYMILDPKSWDSMPTALVSDDVIAQTMNKMSFTSSTRGAIESW